MTVTYSATKNFLGLLFLWKGSVWKAVGFQYMVFIVWYYVLNLIYRFAMSDGQKLEFEKIVIFFKQGNNFIPIQFLLGFYVSKVISNWWAQLECISWPDKFLLYVSANIHGLDQEARTTRRTLARYTNLVTVLVWREVSVKVKRRFPTEEQLVGAGLMSKEEMELYLSTNGKHGRWFIPISWIVNILARCLEQKRFSEFAYQKLLEELVSFRAGSAMLCTWDWVSLPLVYTQVVTLATYGYFVICLIGRQSLRRDGSLPGKDELEVELFFPLFTTLEFLFYIGWLKVGEELRFPFGEDDEDFDMNYALDRNIHVSGLLVNDLYEQRPVPVDDHFFDAAEPELPHTVGSYRNNDEIPPWRLDSLRLPQHDLAPFPGNETHLPKYSVLSQIKSLFNIRSFFKSSVQRRI